MGTYRVVAFIVTVRLVENRVNSSVGREKVVNLRAQYKIVEMR